MSVAITDLDIVYRDVRFVRINAEALAMVQIVWSVVIIATGLYFIPCGIIANIDSPWQIGQEHAPTPTFPELLLVPGWTWLWRVPAILSTAISTVKWCRFEAYILVERYASRFWLSRYLLSIIINYIYPARFIGRNFALWRIEIASHS